MTTTDVTFDGATYSIPEAEEWTVETLLAYEDGKVGSTVRALLGPVQWATFTEKPRTVRDLKDLFEVIGEALDAGN